MTENQSEPINTGNETVAREIKAILFDYIVKVNSRYHATEFTSSQLAKRVMVTTGVQKTRFPIIHHFVKEALRAWEEQGLCTYISSTKYSRCRKTKDTYRFNRQGIKDIKKRTLEETIRAIGEGGLKESPIMRSRDTIIKERLEELMNQVAMKSNEAFQEEV